MRDIIQYFDLINATIENSPVTSAELELEQLDSRRGTIDGTLYFSDGSRLEFTERVVIEKAKPIKRAYRYQYVKSQSPIFRYDNAPHHPLLASFSTSQARWQENLRFQRSKSEAGNRGSPLGDESRNRE